MFSSRDGNTLPKKKLTTYGKSSGKARRQPSHISGRTQPSPSAVDTSSSAQSLSISGSNHYDFPSSSPEPPPRAHSVNPRQRPLKLISQLDRKRKLSKGQQDVSRKVKATHNSESGRLGDRAEQAVPNTLNSREPSLRQMEVDGAGTRDTTSPIPSCTPEDRESLKPASRSMPFSPGTIGILDDLLAPDDPGTSINSLEMPLRPIQKQGSTANPRKQGSNSPKGRPSAIRKRIQPAHRRSRRRLIDALVEQNNGPQDEAKELDLTNTTHMPNLPPFDQQRDGATMDFQGPGEETNLSSTPLARQERRYFKRSESGLKFTYGQQRSTLEEPDMLEALADVGGATMSTSSRRLQLSPRPPAKKRSYSFEDNEDVPGSASKATIRPIHELRQAGANTRAADEMLDLLGRLGTPTAKPSSLRRGALFEVAQRVHDKTFRRQFRDHGLEASLFKRVGAETDSISGFAILSTLLTVLATSTSLHIIRLLQAEDVSNLFTLLLGIKTDIGTLAKDRKSNLSKMQQSNLIKIQNALLGMKIWEPIAPRQISPRTVALKCLEYVTRQEANAAQAASIMPVMVIDHIFKVLNSVLDRQYWTFSEASESVDLYLALTVLESYSIRANESETQDQERWSNAYLPAVAQMLQISLEADTKRYSTLKCLVLKVTLNITNNNPYAADQFVSSTMLSTLAQSVCSNFRSVLTSVKEDEFRDTDFDTLVLTLGVLINFAEQCPSTRRSLYECGGHEPPPIDDLIQIFLNHHRTTSEADSVEKSRVNVAFGYLTVLLGYLSLYGPVRTRFQAIHSSKSLAPLLESLREFIVHHRAMEADLVNSDDDGHRPPSDSTRKLQDLVAQLEDNHLYG